MFLSIKILWDFEGNLYIEDIQYEIINVIFLFGNMASYSFSVVPPLNFTED
jgi:hypothetical protein